MLVLTLNPGVKTTFTNRETGEVITIKLARGGDSPRVGIEASLTWDIVRGDAKKRHLHPVQPNESDLNDIARRSSE